MHHGGRSTVEVGDHEGEAGASGRGEGRGRPRCLDRPGAAASWLQTEGDSDPYGIVVKKNLAGL